MPTGQQIQDLLLSASLQTANKVEANRVQMSVGNNEVKWASARLYTRNILALGYQYGVGDYTSSTTLTLYDCLSSLVGVDTEVNTIDPNFQIPNGTIVIVNPSGYIAPLVFGWADFSTDGSTDGGVTRITYYNANWKGVNPFMALTSPMLTGLELGVDYSLVPTGGFVLLTGGNLEGIVDGQIITAYSYAFI